MHRLLSPRNRSLAAYLCLGLTTQFAWAQAPAQTPEPGPAPAIPAVIQPAIRILVLQGNRSINNLPNGLITVPVVEVRDENDRVVEGAKVTFTLPAAAGPFEKGGSTAEIVTNHQGQAVAPMFKPAQLGAYVIEVAAEFANLKASAKIPQSNSDRLFEPFPRPEKKGGIFSGKKKFVWIAAAAAGAGIGVWAARRDSGGGNSDIITVIPGGVTVGGPR